MSVQKQSRLCPYCGKRTMPALKWLKTAKCKSCKKIAICKHNAWYQT